MNPLSLRRGRRSAKAGLPPGSLIHIGEASDVPVSISIFDYNEAGFTEQTTSKVEDCFPFRDKTTTTWIDVNGIHQTEIIQKLSEHFGIHPLVQEDIVNTTKRPKKEEYDTYIYIVIKMIFQEADSTEVHLEQVSIILGKNFVISFQEAGGDVFEQLRQRIRNDKSRLRKMGADYLAYAIIDAVIDGYFGVLEKLGEVIEDLEAIIVERPTSLTLREMYHLKRQMLFLRRAVWPLREVLSSLEREDSPLIKKATRLFLRDVYDHAVEVIDIVETYRDMTAGLLEIYLSSASNRLNSIMKTLTIFSAIFLPLSFIAGIFGMNFKYMPELESHYGYPGALAGMAILAIVMLVYFRMKDWI